MFSRRASDRNRIVLAPFVGQRLTFVGVVLAINRHPYRKKDRQLVLASLFAPAQNLEIDHLCLTASAHRVRVRKIRPMHVYTFTGRIHSYWHQVHENVPNGSRVQKLTAQSRAYGVTDIAWSKFRETPDALKNHTDLSLFLRNRLRQFGKEAPARQWAERLRHLPNDGSREAWIHQKQIERGGARSIKDLYLNNPFS